MKCRTFHTQFVQKDFSLPCFDTFIKCSKHWSSKKCSKHQRQSEPCCYSDLLYKQWNKNSYNNHSPSALYGGGFCFLLGGQISPSHADRYVNMFDVRSPSCLWNNEAWSSATWDFIYLVFRETMFCVFKVITEPNWHHLGFFLRLMFLCKLAANAKNRNRFKIYGL